MDIKRFNIDPTEENILETLRDNKMGRNDTLKNFLELLDKASDMSVFALNADWGEGKTFFTLQAKMILEYLNPNCAQDVELASQLQQLLSLPQTTMPKPLISKKLIPIYYNAWLYDDHKDPLLSFLYFLSITFQRKYTKVSESALKRFSQIVNLVSSWKLKFNYNSEEFVEAFLGKDAAKEIVLLEDVKLLMDEAFCDILEDNEGVVVFVDELDRCNPRYAVDFLEMIKHFFCCANVQFVFSTNIKQLSETVRNVYGAGFDGTRYLNKFFDLIVELPPVELKRIVAQKAVLSSRYHIGSFSRNVLKTMNFSIREANDFWGRVNIIATKCQSIISGNWNPSVETFAYTCYPIILLALSLADRSRYDAFINGFGEDILFDLVHPWNQWKDVAQRTLYTGSLTSDMTTDELMALVKENYHLIWSANATDDFSAEIRHSILEVASLIG